MQLEQEPREHLDPETAATRAGLRYVSDDEPGITRNRRGKGFAYFFPDGSRINDPKTIRRIRQLAIPPAWTEVWISPLANGHIDATGRDARRRKQYRYHPDFAEVRNAAKFEHILGFAKVLPRFRRRVARDIARRGLPREKVLATIVYLLEKTLIRVGNESYAKENKSYGLTTLRNRHVQIKGPNLQFIFRAKSGKTWRSNVESRRVAKVIRACQDLPGQRLFEYRDETGTILSIDSSDVNAYLRSLTGRDITAKDFRTWQATVTAATALDAFVAEGDQPAKAHVRSALEEAAAQLRNTVAICRKCYVHSAVLSSYEAGQFALDSARGASSRYGLDADERAVLQFLKRRLKQRRSRMPRQRSVPLAR